MSACDPPQIIHDHDKLDTEVNLVGDIQLIADNDYGVEIRRGRHRSVNLLEGVTKIEDEQKNAKPQSPLLLFRF
jgi:hypothetical protein